MSLSLVAENSNETIIQRILKTTGCVLHARVTNPFQSCCLCSSLYFKGNTRPFLDHSKLLRFQEHLLSVILIEVSYVSKWIVLSLCDLCDECMSLSCVINTCIVFYIPCVSIEIPSITDTYCSEFGVIGPNTLLLFTHQTLIDFKSCCLIALQYVGV